MQKRDLKKTYLLRSTHDGYGNAIKLYVTTYPKGYQDADLEVAFTHVGSDGRIYIAGEFLGGFEDYEKKAASVESWVASLGELPCAPSCEIVTEVRNAKGEISYQGWSVKTPVHIRTQEGTTVCGSTATATASNPERFDPWNKQTVSADERRSVYVDSFRPATCKKCLRKQKV